MIRPLLLTAALGIVASIACFSVAFAFGGFTWKHWSINIDDDGFAHHVIDGGGPVTTRNLAWSGGDTLSFAAPIDVTYTQGSDAKVVVTGPQGAADAVMIEDGRIRLREHVHNIAGLRVAVTAPGVKTFVLTGSGDLKIDGLDQDDVAIKITGSGDVSAQGKARSLSVNIAGSGDANLGRLQVDTAEAHIMGSGDTVLSAVNRVDAFVAGSGDIRLASEPRELQSHIMGSGDVIHTGPRGAEPPAGPPPPAPPLPPKPPAPPAPPAPKA